MGVFDLWIEETEIERVMRRPSAERIEMDDPAHPPGTTFQHLLNREILVSERRRMLILAALLAFILVLILLAVTFAPGLVRSIYRDRLPTRAALAAFSAFIAYELFAAGVLTIFLRRGRNFPVFGRYMNALIETSFPTVLLYLLAGYLSAPVIFGTWPALLYFLFIILSTLRLSFALSAFTGAVAAVELFALASFILHLGWRTEDPNFSIGYHLTRSAVLLAAGVMAGYVGTTVKAHFRRALAAASARDELTNLFGQHVSPRVVERLIAMGAAELSEMRRVCVMFVDIRSFTAAARARTPAEVVARLDAVFEILVDIVDRRNGIVNKFLGDGLLAIFGAPIDDPLEAANAVLAAREMLSAIGASNEGDPWPIRLGIGIHIGQAVAGTVGSPRRKEYTVIGDTVNLASRLESLNKEVGSQLIVSDAVREAAGDAIGEASPLGPVSVRGYAEPVAAWCLA
jgi:adenylate cyclase